MKTLFISTFMFLMALIIITGCAAKTKPQLSPREQALQILLSDPENIAAHQQLKQAWIAEGETDAEMIENEQTILDSYNGIFPEKWNPTHKTVGSALNHQAWHLITHNRGWEYADVLIKKALELIPNECDFLDTLAELQYRRGETQEAIATIKLALEQKNDRGRPMGRGKIQYLEKQLARFEAGPFKKE